MSRFIVKDDTNEIAVSFTCNCSDVTARKAGFVLQCVTDFAFFLFCFCFWF